MKDYRRYSYWLETAGDDLTPRPRLDGPITADVAILGAGYSGLWTAYYLLRRRPSLQIAIIEREIAGFGASGRNGGWCTSGFPLSPTLLEERFGCESARAMQVAMYDAVDEVGRVCAEEAIDAHFLKSGALRIARGRHQLPAIEGSYARSSPRFPTHKELFPLRRGVFTSSGSSQRRHVFGSAFGLPMA